MQQATNKCDLPSSTDPQVMKVSKSVSFSRAVLLTSEIALSFFIFIDDHSSLSINLPFRSDKYESLVSCTTLESYLLRFQQLLLMDNSQSSSHHF